MKSEDREGWALHYPSTPGWYWIHSEKDGAEVVHITTDEYEPGTLIAWITGSDKYEYPSEMVCRWLGPLPNPPDPA